MTDTAAKPATPQTSQLTKYVILEPLNPDDDGTWTVAAHIAARSAESAIKAHAEKAGHDSSFIAIPQRHWRPVTVTVETKTTIRLG